MLVRVNYPCVILGEFREKGEYELDIIKDWWITTLLANKRIEIIDIQHTHPNAHRNRKVEKIKENDTTRV
jgi:hypothetical protein